MKLLKLNTLILIVLTQMLFAGDSVPEDLQMSRFSGPDITPSPATLCVSAQGEVFVGVDLIGSVGKGAGKGKIIRLVDEDKDGVADRHTVFAEIDNPRGFLAVGKKFYVLHSNYDEDGMASGMDLSLLLDENADGVADGPPQPLVQNLSTAKFVKERGADHCTNDFRMGIDGWIYIAVGDFGFHEARGSDGRVLTQLGGGVLRVRPDGTKMEMYTTGLRNIYDVAIDPFMNIFTRGNTNDGRGWNIRFAHQIQSGEYGYPRLFLNFPEEVIPALADLGGGSGCGALYLDEPTWPDAYNKKPLMADWGKRMVYIHGVEPDGASFKQTEKKFIRLSQVTDLDVDPSGQMFLSAWAGAGFKGNEEKGYVIRVVPKEWKYKPFPDLKTLNNDDLLSLLQSDSSSTRFYAQRELLSREDLKGLSESIRSTIKRAELSPETTVAFIYTYAQVQKDAGDILSLPIKAEFKEHILRAAADYLPSDINGKIVKLYVEALSEGSAREKVQAAVALGKLKHPDAIKALLNVSYNKDELFKSGAKHDKPNADVILPHVAVKSLVKLNATDDCLNALGTKSEDLALWAISYMHDRKLIKGLKKQLKKTSELDRKKKIIKVISRLYHREAPYDGSWWWRTKPDTRGPYYIPEEWAGSKLIKKILLAEHDKADADMKDFLAGLNDMHRMDIKELGTNKVEAAEEESAKVDLQKIASQEGAVGKTPIEDVILALDKKKGDIARGKVLYMQQGCVACHALEGGGTNLGPFMGQIGSIMNREQIATAILRPNYTISQGFQSVEVKTKDGLMHSGFITESDTEKVVIRDITGQKKVIPAGNIVSEKRLPNSMMPEGLANSLSIDDFVSLVDFLSSKK